MSLIKRIINIWHLSSVEIPKEKKTQSSFIKKMFSQHAIIVEMKNPVEEFNLE